MNSRQVTVNLALLATCLVADEGTYIDVSLVDLVLREAMAVRISAPPRIDGSLNEAVWTDGEVITDLFQIDPNNLEVPTERTEISLLYDDENLYVGFRSYDTEPEKIIGRLARRDSWVGGPSDGGGGRFRGGGNSIGVNSSDWVGVAVDSRDDNRTAYHFIVNAAGSKLDSYIYDDTRYDPSWDAVWDAGVAKTEDGWIAEFRLPFALFNFADDENLTWGLNLKRFVFRKQERIEWPGRKRGIQGNVSRFGILTGIGSIPPPKQLELMPYALGGYHVNHVSKTTRNVGMDIEYGLGTNSTFNMTINPDFGQVEADPSVLNLSAFETFYGEKRPFFVEGMSIFQNPTYSFEGSLFHSRRIGATPGYFPPESGTIVDKPDATTILGAGKLMGRTVSGLEFAVVEAVTNREFAVLETVEGTQDQFMLEPYTNHIVGRVRKPFINELSTVGIMVTDQRRERGHTATVGAFDWRLQLADNRLSFIGQVITSSSDGKSGNAGRLHLSYNDPVWWNANVTLQSYDDDFSVNDLGYLRRAGISTMDLNMGLRKQDPWGPFIRNDLHIGYDAQTRNDGIVIERQVSFRLSSVTKKYWTFGTHLQRSLPSYSDEDTFRDPRAWVRENALGYRGGTWISTDSRKWLSFAPSIGYGWRDNGYYGYRYGTRATIRSSRNISVSMNAARHVRNTPDQWVGIVSGDGADHRIYGNALQTTTDISLRLSWGFTPDFSLQAYVQPFRAEVEYSDYQELLNPMSRAFAPFSYSSDKSFVMDNAVGTFVLRWEYLPGSLLYVVYNLNDRNYYSAAADNWYPTKSNTLFVKLNYWFQA